MKRIIIFLLPLLLISCNNLGSTRVKNLIDLTTPLEVEVSSPVILSATGKNHDLNEKTEFYKLGGGNLIASPVIAKKIIYCLDENGSVQAFSLQDKKIIWSTNIVGNSNNRLNIGGISYSDDKLFVTNGTRNLIILDATSGIEIMRKEFPDILRTKPAMATDRLLIVQTISNQLFAYDIVSSEFAWMFEGGLETISVRNNISPIIYNNNVLIADSSGEVIYLDAKTGQIKWSIDLTDLSEAGIPNYDLTTINTQPVIDDHYVYFATGNSKIMKIDLNTGYSLWQTKAEDVQSMSLCGDNLFITTNARQIAALSSTNGKIKWVGNLISAAERNTKKPRPVLFQAPFVSKNEDNKLVLSVIGSNGELYQFEGSPSGELPIQPHIRSIDKNIFYYWICCCDGHLYTVNNKGVRF